MQNRKFSNSNFEVQFQTNIPPKVQSQRVKHVWMINLTLNECMLIFRFFSYYQIEKNCNFEFTLWKFCACFLYEKFQNESSRREEEPQDRD